MIDQKAADWLFWIKHPPITDGSNRLLEIRIQNLRRAVWDELVRNAGDDGYVTLAPAQITAATGRPPRQRRNVSLALKWLCTVSLMADAGHRGPHTYQLLLPTTTPAPAPAPQRYPRDPRLQAYDERATAWSYHRRRSWRAVWRAILLCADADGIVIGDIAVLADLACDRFGVTVSDATVARVLKWSVASGMTEHLHRGRVPVLRIIAGRRSRQHRVAAPR